MSAPPLPPAAAVTPPASPPPPTFTPPASAPPAPVASTGSGAVGATTPTFRAPVVPDPSADGATSALPVVPAPAPPEPPRFAPAPVGTTDGVARPATGTSYRGGPDLASIGYGGTDGPGHSTIAFPAANPVENSGSLTGHILAQGWSDTPAPRSRTTRVVIVLAASLGLLVAISVLVVLLANDVMDGLVGNMLSE
ncbi:hypothetical protein ACQP2H_01875 [Micromonospora sp. CA-248260]|uniref:hypothetical protein n=1 Tax=Micromonospora sp. CA-248260 TaxID=3239962 RepID=UPI003D8E1BAF